jgi:hypothetical protein
MKNIIHHGFVLEIPGFVTEKFCKDAIDYINAGDTSCLVHSHQKHLASDTENNFLKNCFQWSEECLVGDIDPQDGFGFVDILKVSAKIKENVESLANSSLYNAKIAFHKYVADSWGPEHVDNCPYASILYLNDNYEGGELVFTKKNVSIKPNSRSVYIFRGIGNAHKVNKIVGNDRYALVSFWKHKDSKRNREDELKYDS